MSGITVHNNVPEVMSAMETATRRALTAIGIKAERYAKDRCPVGTPESTGIPGYRGGTLRNSITYVVDGNMLYIGSNVEYAPYVELGTGPFYDTPPEWVQNFAPQGTGAGHAYVRPRPYLRPAILDHIEEYKSIATKELSNM